MKNLRSIILCVGVFLICIAAQPLQLGTATFSTIGVPDKFICYMAAGLIGGICVVEAALQTQP